MTKDSIDLYKSTMDAWGGIVGINEILGAEGDLREGANYKAVKRIRKAGFDYISSKINLGDSKEKDIPYQDLKEGLMVQMGEKQEQVSRFAQGLESVIKTDEFGDVLETLATTELVRNRIGKKDNEQIMHYASVMGAKNLIENYGKSGKKGFSGLSDEEKEAIVNYAVNGVVSGIDSKKDSNAMQREARLSAMAIRGGYFDRDSLVGYAEKGVNYAIEEFNKKYQDKSIRDIAGKAVVDIANKGDKREFETLMGTIYQINQSKENYQSSKTKENYR